MPGLATLCLVYLDCLPMTGISLNASSALVYLPDFNLAVHSAGKNKMSGLWKPLYARNTLCVTLPLVNLPLGQEALVRRSLGLEVDSHVLWDVEEGPVLVVVGILDVHRRTLLDRLVFHLKSKKNRSFTAFK